MLAGIRDILLITTPEHQEQFINLLGDGSHWGISLTYATQDQPRGLADAFIIGRKFISNDNCALVLGDNLFHGHGLSKTLQQAANQKSGATIFAYPVHDPERYGIVIFDRGGRPVSLEEKPRNPRSNWAVTGLYFYDNLVTEYAAELKPSARGELEITDLNRCYLKHGALDVERLGRGFTWFDAGTHDALAAATEFVRTMEYRQGLKIACIEEIAFRMGYIDAAQLLELSNLACTNDYSQYLLDVLEKEEVPYLPGISANNNRF